MANIFDLMTDAERIAYKKFWDKHVSCSFDSSMGGKRSIIITPTGLGNVIECRCNACGEIEDITDTNNW